MVAPTNLDRSSPTRNSVSAMAAPTARGQIESTLTKGTKAVTLKIKADRTTSSRFKTTVSELMVSAVTIRPKVLTCGPEPPFATTASLTATLFISSLLRAVKSGDQVVASSAAYPATYLRTARPE